MHQPWFDVLFVLQGQISKAMYQGIDQGACIVAVCGMDHQACFLVDHDQVVIFKQDIDGDVLGDQLNFAGRISHHDADHIAGLDFVVRFYGLFVDQDVACLCGHLDLVAAGIFDARSQIFVDPQQALSTIGDKAVMLVQLLFVAAFFQVILFGKVSFVYHSL